MKCAIHLLFIVILSVSYAHSQISSSDQKKIQKIVGENFLRLQPSPYYTYYPPSLVGLRVDTSTTYVGDTVGLIYKNEYVLFHDLIASTKRKEVLKYLASTPVTVGEYKAFTNDVLDSIIRLRLYHSLTHDDEAMEYIHYEDTYVNEHGQISSSEPSDSENLLNYFPLNKEKKYSLDDPNVIVCTRDLYVYPHDQFRAQRIFDDRKIHYQYRELIDSLAPDRSEFHSEHEYISACSLQKAMVNTTLMVANDNDFWAKNALHDFDECAVFSQLYDEMDGNNPVVGLFGSQAKAFCHWKQVEIQKLFDRDALPFIVRVTLPENKDLDEIDTQASLRIERNDYTQNWKITQDEYSDFTDYVMDSILRYTLYFGLESDKKASKLLDHDRIYLEQSGEFAEFDPSQREENLRYFYFKHGRRLHQNNPEVKQIMSKVDSMDRSTIQFLYSFMLCRYRSNKYQFPHQSINENGQFVPPSHQTYYSGDIHSYDYKKFWYNLDNKNTLGDASGVRILIDLRPFMMTERVSIFSDQIGKLSDNSDERIPSLTYEQAMAFYNWKYPIDKFNAESNWQDFVYPSKEQFEAIQRGESIIIPEHEVAFPTPLFRYVVHVFPKK